MLQPITFRRHFYQDESVFFSSQDHFYFLRFVIVFKGISVCGAGWCYCDLVVGGGGGVGDGGNGGGGGGVC